MLKPVLQNPWVQTVALLGALLGLGVLAYLLSPVLIPLGLAFLVAYVLDPVVDYFETRRIPRHVTISVLAVLAILLLLSVPCYLVPSIVSQARELATADVQSAMNPDLHGRAVAWINTQLRGVVEFLGLAPAEGQTYEPVSLLASRIGAYVQSHASQLLGAYGSSMASAGQQAGWTVARFFAGIGNAVVSFFLFLANFALFAFVAGYLLKDFDGIKASAGELIPPKYRPRLFGLLSQIDRQLRHFLQGQVLVCLCLGLMYMLGLLLSGVPFAVPIAVFGAVASFVPYLGFVLTIGPSLILVLLAHGIGWQMVLVLVTFAVAQLAEGWYLTPKIVGDKVGLNPVWVILAIMVFGSALGFLGLVIAVPMAASLKVLVVEAIQYYKLSPVYAATVPSLVEESPSQAPAPRTRRRKRPASE